MRSDARMRLVSAACEPHFDLRDESHRIFREFGLTARSAERVFAVRALERESRVTRLVDAHDHVAHGIDDLAVAHSTSVDVPSLVEVVRLMPMAIVTHGSRWRRRRTGDRCRSLERRARWRRRGTRGRLAARHDDERALHAALV